MTIGFHIILASTLVLVCACSKGDEPAAVDEKALLFLKDETSSSFIEREKYRQPDYWQESCKSGNPTFAKAVTFCKTSGSKGAFGSMVCTYITDKPTCS